MNVRKRGLALLMCICMIFTLLPFSAFADASSDDSVVYGKYDNGPWTQVDGMTADSSAQNYENKDTGADVTYSKTATPVEGQKDTYKITLKIESKTSSTAPGASAVVLVIDSSGSMKDGRLTNAKKVAKSFIDSYGTSGADRYLAVVNFDTYANAFEFGRKNNKTSWLDVSNGTNRQSAKNGFDNLSVGGGTNLEQGLTKAKDLLNASTVKSIANENKFVIVLTDGAPTYYSAEKNGNFITGYYPEGKGDSCDQATYDATVTAATKLKNSANSVYTVCYGAQNEIIDCTKETVSNFLKTKIATSAALAYEASDGYESLKTAFEEIYESIEQGLSSGFTVTDPMGKYIQLQDASLTDCTINKGTITWTPTTGEVSEKNGVKTYTYTLTYTVKLDTSANGFVDNKYYATNGVTTLAFKDGDENITRNFNVPGVKGESPKCTVTYNKGDHGNLAGQDTDGNVVHSSVKLGSATPKAPDVTPDNGWYFTGWDKDIAPTVTEDVTYTAQYAEKKTITVTAKSDTAEYNGSERLVNGFETLEFAIDGETYTVSGLTASASGIDANDYVSKVEGTAVVKDSSGKDVTERFTVNTVDGKLTITPKTVTLTGESAARTYTGKEIELTGITPVGLLDGHKLSGVSYSAKGTDASATPYPGKFSDKDKLVITDAAGNDVTTNYNVEYKSGALTIEPIGTVIVTIKGNTDSKVYNGTEQSVTGFTVVSISDTNYKATDFSLKVGVEAKATGTNASDTAYPMGLTADSFVNNNSNFKNVTFVVEDGSLTITKRPLTIEGQSSEPITYDGQTHSFMDWWPVTATDNTGLVSGHEVSGISYLLTGKNAGDYTGKFSGDAKIMSGEENVTENYSIEYTLGKMKIVPAERIAVKIIGNHEEVWYNGQEQSVSGFTFDVADNTVTVELKDGHYAIAKGTNVKTYYMGLKSDDFTINHKNYKEVSVEIVDGYLTIKRHYTPNPPITDKITVEITGNSDSVVYDGTEHSVKDYTVKISDSRYTEKDFTFSGKALASGINAGTYEMGLKADQFKNTNARFKNVEFVIKADGVLTITQRPLTITAGSAEGIAPVTCDKYTVEGLATGDKVDSVKITGIQSEPGESPNVASDAVIKNAKGEDVTANYKITYVDGVLKAIEVLNKEIHFNYVIGYTDGTIRPNNDISRAEVATIFFRLLTDEAREQYTTTAGNFTDVKVGMWCNRAIATLTNMGIIKGYTDGSFQPNKSITRAELATIIARFAKLDVNTKTFSDINGHWAQKNIELAAGNGWINGYEDGTFRPNNNITRAETFAMINRVLDRQTESVSDLLPTSEMNMWSDNLNENAWYYKDVQEATNYHKCDRVGDSVYEKWTEKVPDIDWASYQI